jgi:hypothetical protein
MAQPAQSTIKKHNAFTQVFNLLVDAAVTKTKGSRPASIAECLLRIACHYETRSLESTGNPDPLTLRLALVHGAGAVSLDDLLQTFTPPDLLPGDRFTGWYVDEVIDQIAVANLQPSHFYIPTVRVQSLFSRDPDWDLDAVVENARQNLCCPVEQRLHHFLVEEMPADTRAVHLVYNVGSHWIHVRTGLDETNAGQITVHDSLSRDRDPAAQAVIRLELQSIAALIALTPGLAWPVLDWKSLDVSFATCFQQKNGYDCGAFATYALIREMRPDTPGAAEQGCRLYTLQSILAHVSDLPRRVEHIVASRKAELDTERQAGLASGGAKQQDLVGGHALGSSDARHSSVAFEVPLPPERSLGAGAKPARSRPYPAEDIRQFFAEGGHAGGFATGAILTARQYNVSRPRWAPDEDKLIADGLARGLRITEIAAKYFSGRRTSSAVVARAFRKRAVDASREAANSVEGEATEEGDAEDEQAATVAVAISGGGGDEAEDAERVIFNRDQARLFATLRACWRSQSGVQAHMVFRYATPPDSDLSDLPHVLADYRYALEHSRPIPKKHDTRIMPFNVILALSLNDHQNSAERAVGGVVQHWKGTAAQVVYFSTAVRWTAGRRAEWGDQTLFDKMRCCDSTLGWMWRDPRAETLAVYVLFAEDNDRDETFGAELHMTKRRWKAVVKGKGENPMVLLCLPDRILHLTLRQLASGDGGIVAQHDPGNIVRITVDVNAAGFTSWCVGGSLPIDEDLAGDLMTVLRIYHSCAMDESVEGMGLEDWVDVAARLHPGE